MSDLVHPATSSSPNSPEPASITRLGADLAGLWPYGAAALSAYNGLDAIQLPKLPLARVEVRLVPKNTTRRRGVALAAL
jgi:hypothetical protein